MIICLLHECILIFVLLTTPPTTPPWVRIWIDQNAIIVCAHNLYIHEIWLPIKWINAMHSTNSTKIKKRCRCLDQYGQENRTAHDWMQKQQQKYRQKVSMLTKWEKTDKNVNKLIRDRQMTCAFNGHIGLCVRARVCVCVLQWHTRSAHSHIHASPTRLSIAYQHYIPIICPLICAYFFYGH